MAGVMGNPLGNKTNTSKNLDDYRDEGIYDIIADSSMTNQPENSWATLIVTAFEPNKKYIRQVFKPFGSAKYYVRLFNGTEWASWSRGDNFGYNTLEELAAALKPLL